MSLVRKRAVEMSSSNFLEIVKVVSVVTVISREVTDTKVQPFGEMSEVEGEAEEVDSIWPVWRERVRRVLEVVVEVVWRRRSWRLRRA